MNGIEMAQMLREGQCVQLHVRYFAGSAMATMISGRAGLDFVFLDTEHAVLDRSTLAWMCQTYAGLGTAADCPDSRSGPLPGEPGDRRCAPWA